MKTRLLGGIAAALLAIIGTVLLVVYVQNADRRAAAGMQPVDVLIVQDRIAAGTPVDKLGSAVKLESVPSAAVPAGAVSKLSDQKGKVTSVELQPGEQVLASRLVSPNEVTVPGTVAAPEGKQEITLLLEPERLVGGRLAAGDTVGVFISVETEKEVPANALQPEMRGFKEFTDLKFRKVLVTSVQQAPSDSGAKNSEQQSVPMPSGSAFVTLAVTDAEASKLVFAAEFGKIWLSKDPESATNSNPPVSTLAEVF
ncbi:Flp pilus assembly protein CpaB [Arthrobacter sp. I2-34]|uniref:Flp pilus assembly protein CpaB n=1 Tax=Arthrobacter hankyongi TaxID=2904801 RepID=A0ABS9L4W5_9MICC|nr:Flp pilus assembly protein CpaB [Arthrobacter hankyongi]MCG2621613.1 Flp pilus assembly protein CpaB [Arthrobacter hankyongi]